MRWPAGFAVVWPELVVAVGVGILALVLAVLLGVLLRRRLRR